MSKVLQSNDSILAILLVAMERKMSVARVYGTLLTVVNERLLSLTRLGLGMRLLVVEVCQR